MKWHCRQMRRTRDFYLTGKPTRGRVKVKPAGFAEDEEPAARLQKGVDFARSLPAR